MAPWLLALLQVLPGLIQAIIAGLKGDPPAATASVEDIESHAVLLAKYEAIEKML